MSSLRTSLVAALLSAGSLAAAEPDFTKDIQPLLDSACVSCHGPKKQKGNLRLDAAAPNFGIGESGSALKAGDPAKSHLIQRVISSNPDDRMPPDGPALKPESVQLLKTWITAGAKRPEVAVAEDRTKWWSFQPIKYPAPPVLPETERRWSAHPIDRFVRVKQLEQKLKPAVLADRRTLIRRLSFDLLGLPPAPEEVEKFANDPAADAYEKLVDRYLAAPQYGERWARHWLDVVHFGDSHGYDKDKPRPNAWPYRDYVIRSLNADKPYARFVQEQIAGDVLFPGTQDGIEALGFIAAGPWDFIGHAEVPETKIDGKVARHLDRDDMVANTMSTFMSMTVHCAQCHNHKFDPVSQEDYYRLQAVFAALDRADMRYDVDPNTARQRGVLADRRKKVEGELAVIREAIKKAGGAELARLDDLLSKIAKPVAGAAPEFGYHSALTERQDTVKWVQVDLGKSVQLASVSITGCHDDFADIGAGFGFPVRFKIELADDPEFKTNVQLLADRTATDVKNPGVEPQTFPAMKKQGRYVRITATKLALRQNDYMLALAELEALDASGANVAFGKTVISLDTIEAGPRWRRSNLTDGITYAKKTGIPQNGDELRKQRQDLLNKVVEAKTRERETALTVEVAEMVRQMAALPAQRTAYVGMVYTGGGAFVGTGGQGGKPRPINVLNRGEVTKPGKLVEASALTQLPNIPGEFNLPANHAEGERRAGLARWLSSEKNPLTWRSIVNRVWLYHMGRGLVDSPNDFGRMGQLPSHPELIDWLAAEFLKHNGSFKWLHKTIVMSETYRQSSAGDADAVRADSGNMWYSRMVRRKLEAEAVRDSILMVSGKLDLTMGGPAFQDFVIDKPDHSPHYEYDRYDPEDVRTHRRAVYRFLVRSQLQPFMTTLDCADPSVSVDKRNQTYSPLQALAVLNNKLSIAMAKHFAERVSKEAKEPKEQVRLAVRLALSREPSAEELAALTEHTAKHGLPNTCRLLFNLNEFHFVD
ncbi:DUF1553 domain-containing protein [Zavarzinella formosa]|uniref:DUF1553 domain-containing protein n=1 Tax=Zavarzinella formosa TaxID=360055 RepID=UPI0002F8CE24|nr:DUF1553 domain-containing protein [Zavarzinella formosa]